MDGVDWNCTKARPWVSSESGSGKSTIAYVLVGMYEATDGDIIYKGENIAKAGLNRTLKQRGEIQIVFQDPGSSLNSKRTVGKGLMVPLKIHTRMSKADMVKKARDLLEEVGLPAEFADKYPRTLGGGERQLISVARALATNPSLVILDEPTSALDVSVQAKVISKLIDLQKELGLAYLFITHDLSLMRNVADRWPYSTWAGFASRRRLQIFSKNRFTLIRNVSVLHTGNGGRGENETRQDSFHR